MNEIAGNNAARNWQKETVSHRDENMAHEQVVPPSQISNDGDVDG